MNRLLQLLICATGVVLCQCSHSEKKKSKPSELSLAQRAMRKPDATERSQFEKYLSPSKDGKSGTAAHYQKQTHQSKSFSGGDSYAEQKPFKAGQSWFGKSKVQGMDTTYALGDQQAAGLGGTFKAGASNLGSKQDRAGDSTFRSSNDAFKAGSALTRSKRTGKAPLIIETIETQSIKKSAYTEDEVKRLLNR